MGSAEAYRRYYQEHSVLAPLRMIWDALLSGSRIRRYSLLNRQRDYLRIANSPQLFALHRELNEILVRADREWPSYDYGEGYFYQSFPAIAVSGLRDTRGRVEHMDLEDHVRGRSVLEIGCNTGFLSLSIAHAASRVVGMDINPFLIEIGHSVARHLGHSHVKMEAADFASWDSSERFDVVLSFANHATYDGNMHPDLEEYFARLRGCVHDEGVLLFESHPPAHEAEDIPLVCRSMSASFSIRGKKVLDYGSFLDRGRTFIIADAC